MLIDTKYNIGDNVWIHSLGRHYNAKIIGITINIRTEGDIFIEYGIHRKGCYYQRRETDIFPTKEELLKHINEQNYDKRGID